MYPDIPEFKPKTSAGYLCSTACSPGAAPFSSRDIVVLEELLSVIFISQATCLLRSLATLVSWKMETMGFVFHISTLRLHTTLPHLGLATVAALFLVRKAWLAISLLSGFSRPIRSTIATLGTISKLALYSRAIKTLLTCVLRPISQM